MANSAGKGTAKKQPAKKAGGPTKKTATKTVGAKKTAGGSAKKSPAKKAAAKKS